MQILNTVCKAIWALALIGFIAYEMFMVITQGVIVVPTIH